MGEISDKSKVSERDSDGRRTGFKILIKGKYPMSREGFKRWGVKQRVHIGKHPWIWRYYSSTTAIGLKNGVPIEIMKNDRLLIRYLIDVFLLAPKVHYSIQGWGHRKTKTHVGFTKTLATIYVYDVEKYACKFVVKRALTRYWFRREETQRRRDLWRRY